MTRARAPRWIRLPHLLAGTALALALAAGGAAAADAPGPAGAPAQSGSPAEVDAGQLRDLRLDLVTGRAQPLGAYLDRGGPVLLDFWATWCKPCLEAVPGLRSLHESLGERGLTVIGVSVDGPRNFSKVRPFMSRMRITYPVALDRDGSLQRFFQVVAVPTTVLLDAEGRVVRVQQGFRPGEEKELEAAVRALLPPASDSGADSTGDER